MKEAKNSSWEAWALTFSCALPQIVDRMEPHIKWLCSLYYLNTHSESKTFLHIVPLSLVCDTAMELRKTQHIYFNVKNILDISLPQIYLEAFLISSINLWKISFPTPLHSTPVI